MARRRILVVESAPEIVAKLLRAGGHLAMSAADQASAMALWKRAAGGFEIVIFDDRVMEPATAVPEFLTSKPSVRLVVMAGKPADPQLESANVIFLPKPVSPVKLNEAINGA